MWKLSFVPNLEFLMSFVGLKSTSVKCLVHWPLDNCWNVLLNPLELKEEMPLTSSQCQAYIHLDITLTLQTQHFQNGTDDFPYCPKPVLPSKWYYTSHCSNNNKKITLFPNFPSPPIYITRSCGLSLKSMFQSINCCPWSSPSPKHGHLSLQISNFCSSTSNSEPTEPFSTSISTDYFEIALLSYNWHALNYTYLKNIVC